MSTCSRLWTTGDVARVTGLTPQAIDARIKAGKFVAPVRREGRTRLFEPRSVIALFLDEATAEMIQFLDLIIRSETTRPADLSNALETRQGLIDGTIKITDVVKDLAV